MDTFPIIYLFFFFKGYRIYQSVTNAYSLNAWLSTDETPLEDLWSQGDLIYWQDIYNKVEGFLNLTGNTLEHLEDIKPSMLWMKPWLSFVKVRFIIHLRFCIYFNFAKSAS